jgi:hypothetical protein
MLIAARVGVAQIFRDSAAWTRMSNTARGFVKNISAARP